MNIHSVHVINNLNIL